MHSLISLVIMVISPILALHLALGAVLQEIPTDSLLKPARSLWMATLLSWDVLVCSLNLMTVYSIPLPISLLKTSNHFHMESAIYKVLCLRDTTCQWCPLELSHWLQLFWKLPFIQFLIQWILHPLNAYLSNLAAEIFCGTVTKALKKTQ